MSRRRILARLPFPKGAEKKAELVLSERLAPHSQYVQFETSRFDTATGVHSHVRHYIAARFMRSEVLRTATNDFVKRYLNLVVHGSFKGNHKAACYWILTRLDKALIRGDV